MAVPHGAGSFALQGPRPLPPKMEGSVCKGWLVLFDKLGNGFNLNQSCFGLEVCE